MLNVLKFRIISDFFILNFYFENVEKVEIFDMLRFLTRKC